MRMEMRATLVRPKTSAFNGIQALVFAPCSLVPGVIGLDFDRFPLRGNGRMVVVSFQPALTGATHTPNGPGKMQLSSFGLRDHAVEIAAWAAAEVGWRLC